MKNKNRSLINFLGSILMAMMALSARAEPKITLEQVQWLQKVTAGEFSGQIGVKGSIVTTCDPITGEAKMNLGNPNDNLVLCLGVYVEANYLGLFQERYPLGTQMEGIYVTAVPSTTLQFQF